MSVLRREACFSLRVRVRSSEEDLMSIGSEEPVEVVRASAHPTSDKLDGPPGSPLCCMSFVMSCHVIGV